MAKATAEHGVRATSMLFGSIALGIAFGLVIGCAAFFAVLALDGFEGGWLRWFWLPIYATLGMIGFAIRGWYRGQARAYVYLLVDCGLIPQMIDGLVKAALEPIAARLGRTADKAPRIWAALQASMTEDLDKTVDTALERARSREHRGDDTNSLAAKVSARARRTAYGLLAPVLARFISEAASIEAERAKMSDADTPPGDQGDGVPPEVVLERIVERIRALTVDRISGWIRAAIHVAFRRPAIIAAAVPVVVFIVIPLFF